MAAVSPNYVRGLSELQKAQGDSFFTSKSYITFCNNIFLFVPKNV